MDIRADMLSRLKNRTPGYSLDQPFYIDEEFHKLDLEHIWYKDWLFVAHDCESPNPGNYTTVQVGAYSVVIVRGNDGKSACCCVIVRNLVRIFHAASGAVQVA